jgi:hypothetical protein
VADDVSSTVELPANLIDIQGAWHREGRALDGGAYDEPSDVLWLQVGRHFCDLRTVLPGAQPASVLDQAQSFSGTVQVAAGEISFHHDLDSLDRDPAHPDQGTVHRLGPAMYERGPGFEERWMLSSLPGDETAVVEFVAVGGEGVSARLIRIGSLALAVWAGAESGGALFRLNGALTLIRGALPLVDSSDIAHAALAVGAGDPLPSGWVAVEAEEL